jgi:hypothetical protein
MSLGLCIPEHYKMVNILAPAADAGGRTGAWVSLKTVKTAFLVFHITQGNAATIALSINQATAIAGTGSTPIVQLAKIWANLATATSDTLVRVADAVNYTTDAGLALKMVVVEIDPAALSAGFDCITGITGASNAANITACMAYLESRYPQATPPSAVVD